MLQLPRSKDRHPPKCRIRGGLSSRSAWLHPGAVQALLTAGVVLLLPGAPAEAQTQAAPATRLPRVTKEALDAGALRFGEPSFLNIGADDSEEVMQVVRIPILGSAGDALKKDDLRITVRFVERTGYDEDVRTAMVGDDATIKYIWQAEPVDWNEGAEDLEVRCKYLGMGEIVGTVATLEYQNKLQDALMTGRDEDQMGLAQQLSILLANQQCKKLINMTPFGNTETFVEAFPELADGRYNWSAMKGAGTGDLTVKVSFEPTGHAPAVHVRQVVSGIDSVIDTKVVNPPATAELKTRSQGDADIKPPTIVEE